MDTEQDETTRPTPRPKKPAGMSAERLHHFAHERYGDRTAIGTSGQKTGVVIIDLAHRLGLPLRVFRIGTAPMLVKKTIGSCGSGLYGPLFER